MSGLRVSPLTQDHSFGARISGVTQGSLQDPEVRKQILDVFEDRGVILFEGCDATNELHLAISDLFGPLQEHAYKGIPHVDPDRYPGLIRIAAGPDNRDIFRADGQQLSSWIPWHFDACYTSRLNRGGVLRALVVPEEGGETGFADGIQMFGALSQEMKDRFAGLEVLYHPALMYTSFRFGVPDDYEIVEIKQSKLDMIEGMRSAPRAVHPAIWRRMTGEQVLHVSPWQADGIFGMEGPEGDALLADLVAEMDRVMVPYFHKWKPGEMIMWDNWRLLHKAAGHPPGMTREMHRTTILGDYGLGRYEDGVINRESIPAME